MSPDEFEKAYANQRITALHAPVNKTRENSLEVTLKCRSALTYDNVLPCFDALHTMGELALVENLEFAAREGLQI